MNSAAVQPSHTPVKIDTDDYNDLIEQSTIRTTLDLGPVCIYTVQHSTRGQLILINTNSSENAVIQC